MTTLKSYSKYNEAGEKVWRCPYCLGKGSAMCWIGQFLKLKHVRCSYCHAQGWIESVAEPNWGQMSRDYEDKEPTDD